MTKSTTKPDCIGSSAFMPNEPKKQQKTSVLNKQNLPFLKEPNKRRYPGAGSDHYYRLTCILWQTETLVTSQIYGDLETK